MKSVYRQYASYGSDELANTQAGKQQFKGELTLRFGQSLRLTRNIIFALFLLALATTVVHAQAPGSDLTDKSIEDLMDVEVTSVSRKEVKLFETAAAVYVISQEEIRRSGLTSIPELVTTLGWGQGECPTG